MKVLVVDDDVAVRIVASEMLKRLEFVVDSVASGKEALSKLTEQEYAAIFLDVGMPVMSGVEVYAKIRDNLPLQKIVFMTGYSEEEIGDLDNPNTWILPKPFSLVGLTEAVESIFP